MAVLRQVRADRQHHHRGARRKVREAVDERRHEEQPAFQRDELAPRHEVDLPVHGGRLAVGSDEERGVVEHRLADRNYLLIAAEENRDVQLARERAERLLPDRDPART